MISEISFQHWEFQRSVWSEKVVQYSCVFYDISSSFQVLSKGYEAESHSSENELPKIAKYSISDDVSAIIFNKTTHASTTVA